MSRVGRELLVFYLYLGIPTPRFEGLAFTSVGVLGSKHNLQNPVKSLYVSLNNNVFSVNVT